MSRTGVALVLGAGGPVGFAFHAGVLAALACAGWDARGAGLVVGTSIGAVTAGLLRSGMPPADLYARVQRTPLSAEGAALVERAGGWPTFTSPAATGAGRRGHPASPSLLAALARHPRRIRPGLVLAGLGALGTADPGPISDGLDRLMSGWPEAPTWICAVDLDSGRRKVFRGGVSSSFGRAVAASCAVPTYFAPVEIDGRRYVDGGVHSPSNTDLVGALTSGQGRPDAVVVSLPMGMRGDAGRRGVDLPGRRLNSAGAAAGLRPLVDAGVPVFVVEPTARELQVMHYDAFDLTHTGQVAARIAATVAATVATSAVAPALGFG